MFTGIIEEIGRVKQIRRGVQSVSFDIQADAVLEGTRIGDSISTNGVCLTVTAFAPGVFSADVMPETMRMTNLGGLKPGDQVNLERALTLTSRLGGHIVAGHIDGTGRIVGMDKDDTAIWITVSAPDMILKYIVNKGSIAIDGVSLTVAGVGSDYFKVSIIPHTQDVTTLTGKKVGDTVNLENDMLVRYVEHLLEKKENKGMTLEFLLENGF